MKKNRLLLVVALVVAFSTIATSSYGQIRFGLRGEVGLNTPSFSADALEVENLNTFKLGPTVEVMLPAMNFGLEASLLYNNDKMDLTHSPVGEGAVRKEVSVANHYLDIPLNLKYKFGLFLPVKIYAAAGPYARIHIEGDDVDFSDAIEEIKAKSFQAGINLGLGAEIFSRLAVGVNYGIHLSDNYSASKPTWEDILNKKDATWSIQATVYL